MARKATIRYSYCVNCKKDVEKDCSDPYCGMGLRIPLSEKQAWLDRQRDHVTFAPLHKAEDDVEYYKIRLAEAEDKLKVVRAKFATTPSKASHA